MTFPKLFIPRKNTRVNPPEPTIDQDMMANWLAIQNWANSLVAPSTTSDSGWINVTSFLNGWTNYDGSRPARYRLFNGVVFVEMLIVPGTIGAPAFNLPAGYRPSTLGYPTPGVAPGVTVPQLIQQAVRSNGDVIPADGTTPAGFSWYSSRIIFPADN